MTKKIVHQGITATTDIGTPELHQHHEMGIEWATQRQAHAKNLTQWPLDRYYHRGEITKELHEAGNRLLEDFERAHIRQSVGMRWEEFIDQGLPDFMIEDERDRTIRAAAFWEAMDIITLHAGREGEAIVWFVVLMSSCTAGDWAAHKGYKPAFGLAQLRLALTPLIKHYSTK